MALRSRAALVQEQLGDGIAEGANAGQAFGGPSLVDTKNARRYLVARDAGGDPVSPLQSQQLPLTFPVERYDATTGDLG